MNNANAGALSALWRASEFNEHRTLLLVLSQPLKNLFGACFDLVVSHLLLSCLSPEAGCEVFVLQSSVIGVELD